MNKGIFIHAKEIATELVILETHAYKLVRDEWRIGKGWFYNNLRSSQQSIFL